MVVSTKLKVMIKQLGLKRKAFETRFKGPFVIKGKVNDVTFEVEDNAGRKYSCLLYTSPSPRD